MKARSAAFFVVLVLAAAMADAEINLGGGAAYESGNNPLSPVVPLVFVESVYHVDSWETFGIDLFIGSAPFSTASYTSKGLSAGPELFFGTDLSFHFPRIGPADLATLIGVIGFQDYENRVDGVAAQTGLAATLHLSSFFAQGRGLLRFYSSTGMSGNPVPLGVFSFAILGGYSLF